jgi:hypothetical protein
MRPSRGVTDGPCGGREGVRNLGYVAGFVITLDSADGVRHGGGLR